ncbi:ImmA/IrrE family metallo-endopeptidase [Aeromonas caviae]|uniref:ImmA/IrrE family metallo-endopeptidase n=1 Tax=Aeromonas caviae TaxID=648 RepID=UPI002E27F700|nr:ImmA/IrrE family metallo-endopeptidase [Aeromonas caviae]
MDYRYPAYQKGYSLAARTRQLLNLGEFEPIKSLTELVEDTLCIPVVQTELSSRFAGATVAPSDTGRGIIINTKGLNSNIFVRRTTLAHELGHLLWDPEHRLNKLVVDDYEGINNIFTDSFDEVEARANAFAAEFLAPASGVKEIYKKHVHPVDGLRAVMEHYGVSFTTARWQLINSKVVSEEDNFSGIDTTHSHDWTINEEARLSYSPIPSIPESRRGRFEKIILDCVGLGIISSDSAASCLSCTEEEFLSHHTTLNEMY